MKPTQIANRIQGLSGVNPFENTRKKTVIEIRSLLCYVLREKLSMRWIAIKDFFLLNGKRMDNSSLLNAFSNYPEYARLNISIKKIEETFLFENETVDEISKIQVLEARCRHLNRKLKNCEAQNKANTKDTILKRIQTA
tara:strand:- start:1241 stop:1657 length:417 start_codon:yes stop_codon:yes gene_type:complete